MQLIMTLQSKGGAGKTTTTMALASAADNLGERVTLIDSDQNGPLKLWKDELADLDLWPDRIKVEHMLSYDEIFDHLSRLDEKGETDLVIVDTRGGAEKFHEMMAQTVSLILSPYTPTKLDYTELMRTKAWLRDIESRAGEALAPIMSVTVNIPSPSSLTVAERDYLALARNDPHFKTILRRRNAYATLPLQGLLGRTIKALEEEEEAFNRLQAKSYRTALNEAVALRQEVTKYLTHEKAV